MLRGKIFCIPVTMKEWQRPERFHSSFFFFCSVNVSEKHLVSGDVLLVLALTSFIVLLSILLPVGPQRHRERPQIKEKRELLNFLLVRFMSSWKRLGPYGKRTLAERSLFMPFLLCVCVCVLRCHIARIELISTNRRCLRLC